MKNLSISFLVTILVTIIPLNLFPQKNTGGSGSITATDLESHLFFISSPLLKGRLNGEEGLDIAALYIESQAKRIGLKPLNGTSFIHSYSVIRKSIDPEKTIVQVVPDGQPPVVIKEPLYQLVPMVAGDFELEGEVVFAGYGIRSDKYNYNDFDTLTLAGKILLVMDRAPSTPDGKKCLLEDEKWMTPNGLQMKIQALMFTRPKAILIVTDPKSGTSSISEKYHGLTDFLKSGMTLKGGKGYDFDFPGMPKVIFIHRKVADELLSGTGKTLTDLQNAIDGDLKSHSFAIKGKKFRITEASLKEEMQLPNVVGFIEGSDPVLKNEVVIFSGHMDHIGGEGENVNPGADDNASGCAGLLELAEAFQSMQKKPLRSLLFLWVSGEEVGLFGSQSYIDNPLFPLDKTVADLNIDMIGRNKEAADTSDQTPMAGPDTVFAITDYQSKELVSIADAAAKKTRLTLDYSLSGRNHPLMLFARSDHYNFVQKDIPVINFTTGIHTDYHTPGDAIEKIDLKKMELITRTMYEIGYQVANKKTRIVVDNPFSKWSNTGRNPMQQ